MNSNKTLETKKLKNIIFCRLFLKKKNLRDEFRHKVEKTEKIENRTFRRNLTWGRILSPLTILINLKEKECPLFSL